MAGEIMVRWRNELAAAIRTAISKQPLAVLIARWRATFIISGKTCSRCPGMPRIHRLDAGENVPAKTFLKMALEHEPQVIGLSCLLTFTVDGPAPDRIAVS
jgi:hypothetical protein